LKKCPKLTLYTTKIGGEYWEIEILLTNIRLKYIILLMNTVSLTNSGPHFSRIVFGVMKWGAWGHQLTTQQMLSLINESIEAGVTTFDHADIYGGYTTEEEFGTALALQPSLRNKMQIVTKCGIKMLAKNRPSHQVKSYDTRASYILKSVEESLSNLKTDHIDLLLIHRPSPLMEVEEIAEAFQQLKKDGKVLWFGVSNFTTWQYDWLNEQFPLATNQIEASILRPEPFLDGTLAQCQRHKVSPMAWSPLGGGKVFTQPEEEQVQRIRKKGAEIIDRYDHTFKLDQLLLAWLMHHPSTILPVVGTARIDRLKAAVEATTISITQEEWFELWEAANGQEVP
jgi:predicted oxidoreductase